MYIVYFINSFNRIFFFLLKADISEKRYEPPKNKRCVNKEIATFSKSIFSD